VDTVTLDVIVILLTVIVLPTSNVAFKLTRLIDDTEVIPLNVLVIILLPVMVENPMFPFMLEVIKVDNVNVLP